MEWLERPENEREDAQALDVRGEGNGGISCVQVEQIGKDRRMTKRESGQGGGSRQLSRESVPRQRDRR